MKRTLHLLLSRFIAKYSSVLDCQTTGGRVDDVPRVFAATLRSPKGDIAWAIINDAPRAWRASLTAKDLGVSRLFKYQVTSEQHDQASLEIRPLARVKAGKGVTTLQETLPRRFSSRRSGPDGKRMPPAN